jgi:biotin transport system substrate-specific component
MAFVGSPAKQALAVLLALLALSISAQIQPLAGTPLADAVPGTLQTLALLLAAACLGGRLAALTALLYVLLGVAGLPVFSGWSARLGMDFVHYPSAGYLLGFIPAAAYVGRACQAARGLLALLGIMLLGHLIVLAFGISVLAAWIGIDHAFELGCITLLPGMALKTLLAALLVYFGSRLARKTSSSAA